MVMGGGGFVVQGKSFDMDRIGRKVALGSVERWMIRSSIARTRSTSQKSLHPEGNSSRRETASMRRKGLKWLRNRYQKKSIQTLEVGAV